MIQDTARARVQKKQKAVKKKADLKKTLGPKGLSRVMRRTRRLKDAQERAVEARGAEENWTEEPFDLDPPDAAAAASAPAPAEVNAAPDERAAPVLVGDWREVQVDGGTLKWSPSIGAIDAHCVGHAGGELCRMNRKLRAGCLGLSLLWLARHDACGESRYDHEMAKESLSSRDAAGPRGHARADFAARRDPEAVALVEAERLARGGASAEPGRLPCPSIHKTLMRLMENGDNMTRG